MECRSRREKIRLLGRKREHGMGACEPKHCMQADVQVSPWYWCPAMQLTGSLPGPSSSAPSDVITCAPSSPSPASAAAAAAAAACARARCRCVSPSSRWRSSVARWRCSAAAAAPPSAPPDAFEPPPPPTPPPAPRVARAGPWPSAPPASAGPRGTCAHEPVRSTVGAAAPSRASQRRTVPSYDDVMSAVGAEGWGQKSRSVMVPVCPRRTETGWPSVSSWGVGVEWGEVWSGVY
jgi:hypothetical protein